MARRRSIKRNVKLAAVLLVVYAATYLVWSRARTFSIEGESTRFWSFFPRPKGLPVLSPVHWSQWKRREKTAAMIFWPCVLLDEELTDRVYWPGRFADAPRL